MTNKTLELINFLGKFTVQIKRYTKFKRSENEHA